MEGAAAGSGTSRPAVALEPCGSTPGVETLTGDVEMSEEESGGRSGG